MKEFFTENQRTIKRLLSAQIAMTVFAVMITFATAFNRPLNLAASVFAVCFYLCIVYSFMWESGSKLSTRKEKTSKNQRIKTSFFVVGIANFFNFICATVYTFCKIAFLITNSAEGVFTDTGNITWIIIKMTQAMYLGIDAAIFPAPENGEAIILQANPIYFYAILVPTFVVGIVAYVFGSDDFSILRKMGFKVKQQSRSEIRYKSNWK